jgi:hypothetical protein
MSPDPLLAIQQAVLTHIGKAPKFANLPVRIADAGNLLTQVDQVLGIKGIAIAIEPVATDIGYAGEGVLFTASVGVSVIERVSINRSATGTGIRATEVAAALIAWFRPCNNAPCAFTKIALKQDSGDRCEYLLMGTAKEKLTV